MFDETSRIEQLYYTWSTIGSNSSLAAGFRVRAASSGLRTVSDDRVKSLERYLRYNLPDGADRFEVQKNLEQAPISLALLQSEYGERILVHKKYIGQDGVHRLGNFFIHLLAGLPPEFSVKEAISLWGSLSLWRISDEGLGNSTQLDTLSLAELLQYCQHIDVMCPLGIEASQMRLYFPLFMSAYLTWQECWRQWQALPSGEPPRLYVAAPPDMLAALLYGLTCCLPAQLLADLTFSTYEEDVKKARVLLVGTCWLPDSHGKINPKYDLPPECYTSNIAINCYNGGRTILSIDPLIDDFANYAMQCFLIKQLDMLKILSMLQNSTVSTFLGSYRSIIKNAENPSREDIELYFTQPVLAERMLCMESVKNAITHFGLQDQAWFLRITRSVYAKLKDNADFEQVATAVGVYLPDAPEPVLITLPENNATSIYKLDQLCYTFSTIGYNSSLAVGFRIRAASSGLQIGNDGRGVKGLDRHLRYSLPDGADHFEVQKNLEQAPICLALLQSEHGEGILVHKKYVGKDSFGRLGNFFIHLLAGLPPKFSIKDAISLWRSSFWLTSDEGLGTSTQLNSLLLTELLQSRQHIDVLLHPQGIESSWIEGIFPHFLWAYLQWRKRWQQWQTSPSGELPRFYIAAPPDMIAAFICRLTICLPWQLLADLTFSTYENDLRKSPALLVGTCWLPDSQGRIDPTHDLPRECYIPGRGIALNCYRSPKIELKPQDDLEQHFVACAAQCLKGGFLTEMQLLVDNTGKMEHMDVNSFLNEYYKGVIDQGHD